MKEGPETKLVGKLLLIVSCIKTYLIISVPKCNNDDEDYVRTLLLKKITPRKSILKYYVSCSLTIDKKHKKWYRTTHRTNCKMYYLFLVTISRSQTAITAGDTVKEEYFSL